MYTVPSLKMSAVCSKPGRGCFDQLRLMSDDVSLDDGEVGDGSSIVRELGRRSDSKNECEPMLSCVLPERRSRAPLPTMNFEDGKSDGRPT